MRQQVNLLDVTLLPKRRPVGFRQAALVWAALVVLLGVLSLLDGYHLSRLDAGYQNLNDRWLALRNSGDRLRASARRPVDPALAEEVAQLRLVAEGQRQVARLLEGGGPERLRGFSPFLLELAEHHVDGLWLSRIGLDGRGRNVTLRGSTVKAVHVPEFLQALSRGARFKGQRFDSFELTSGEGGVLDFQVVGPQGDSRG